MAPVSLQQNPLLILPHECPYRHGAVGQYCAHLPSETLPDRCGRFGLAAYGSDTCAFAGEFPPFRLYPAPRACYRLAGD